MVVSSMTHIFGFCKPPLCPIVSWMMLLDFSFRTNSRLLLQGRLTTWIQLHKAYSRCYSGSAKVQSTDGNEINMMRQHDLRNFWDYLRPCRDFIHGWSSSCTDHSMPEDWSFPVEIFRTNVTVWSGYASWADSF